jgi:hypothetical protein
MHATHRYYYVLDMHLGVYHSKTKKCDDCQRSRLPGGGGAAAVVRQLREGARGGGGRQTRGGGGRHRRQMIDAIINYFSQNPMMIVASRRLQRLQRSFSL